MLTILVLCFCILSLLFLTYLLSIYKRRSLEKEIISRIEFSHDKESLSKEIANIAYSLDKKSIEICESSVRMARLSEQLIENYSHLKK
jgi:hypothetical protein